MPKKKIEPVRSKLKHTKAIQAKEKLRVPKKISPTRKPDDMSLEEWQAALRKSVSVSQKFRLAPGKPLTREKPSPYFSVLNLTNRNRYDLEIRGLQRYTNYCSCPDYQINTLGTCKHVEFAIRTLSKKTPYKTSLLKNREPIVSEVVVRYEGKRQVIFRPARNIDGSSLRIAKKYFEQDKHADGHVLRNHAHEKFSEFVSQFEGSGSTIRLRDDAVEYIAQMRDRSALKERIDRLFPKGVESTAWKSLLKTDLYTYQKEGALFAARSGRSIIADEMGLGKTIQAIAAVEILNRAVGLERVLIIAPTSLKHQWESEIRKFSHQSLEVIEGFSTRRRELMQTPTFFKITNYDVVRRDLDSLNSWNPDLIILDEAQRIKNWKTSTAQNVKRLRSEHCIVLTGTPLENRVEELHSLVEFVDRFHFGPLFRFLSEHQHIDDSGKVVGYRNLDKISDSLQGLLLRRTKAKVLTQLPPRIDKTFFVPMTEQQKVIHEEYSLVVAQIVAKWRKHHFLSDKDQKRMMAALQYMRMVCNSTFLIDGETRHQNKITELFKIIDEVFESNGSKMVIFSQWLGTHELIIEWATRRKIEFTYFHGSLDGGKRRAAIEKFNTNPKCRLFLSTDAGGVGLNLQAANIVVNMDQPWNPAILEQRIGRSHRLGQIQPVQVFNLVAQGTIEEGMLKTLAFKKSLFTGILDGGQKEIFLGGSRLTKFMESVEEATAAVPSSMGAENLTESDSQNQETSEPLDKLENSPEAEAGNLSVAGKANESQNGEMLNPWAPFMQLGMQLLQSLAEGSPAEGAGISRTSLFQKDEKTGQNYLRVPAPSVEKVQNFMFALKDLLSMSENRK